MKNRRKYFHLLLLLLLTQTILAETLPEFNRLSDNSSISLLTVYPRNKAVYAIFGHTAIRVQDPEQQFDLVYNYGFFDASKPYFIYHFVKGETDYVLGIENFRDFLFSYAYSNSSVDEQVLNLSLEERESIFNFLNINALPENKEYRYDYFFDNCTTRPRDIVENNLQAELVYTGVAEKTSFRDLVHLCTEPYPWLSFGIDLVIGSGADSTISARHEMFLPVKLMLAFDRAKVEKDSVSYPLVRATQTILSSEDKNIIDAYRPGAVVGGRSAHPFFLSPLGINILILLLFSGITVVGYYKKRRFRVADFLLFAAAGIAGCIVCFICFISTHPCTSYNLNVLWLHPFHLIAAVFFLLNAGRKFRYWYHLIHFAVLSIFMLSWCWLPQYIPGAAMPLVLCLWMRSGMRIFRLDNFV